MFNFWCSGQWTQTPSTTPLQPIKWNASFWLCSTSDDWAGWSMDSNPIHHPSPAKKNEMLNFRLRSTSDDQPSWSIDSKSICQPSPANKMKCFFLDYVHFWWSAGLVNGLEPHLPPFSSQKNEMLTGLCSLLMSMDSNPILPLQPPT